MAQDDDKPPIPLEEVTAAAAAVAAERELAGMSRRVGEAVQGWAAPSLIVCVRKADDAEPGWRVIPELTSGHVPRGFETTFAKLVEDAEPGSIDRPSVVRPTDEVAGAAVKLRDNWLVPWTWRDSRGFIFLRGIARPYPANVGDAVALVAQPVWPLACERWDLAERLGVLAGEVKAAADRLRVEVPTADEAAPAGELEALGEQAAELRQKLDLAEAARAQAASDRDRAEAEAAELRDQVESLERRVESEGARGEAKQLAEKLKAVSAERDAAVKARDAADAERERLKGEVESQRERERERDAQLGQQMAELEDARRQLGAVQERIDGAEKARVAADGERERAKGEADNLWRSLDSLQREIQAERERLESEKGKWDAERTTLEGRLREAVEVRTAAERERDEARGASAGASDAAVESDAKAKQLEERWQQTEAAFRGALDALRRTPFVPPALRVTIGGIEGHFADTVRPTGGSRPPRVLILDRDTATLDGLASELEVGGVEVLIAHYAEEVGFFLKTPDSRKVTALVWDVMAFRADRDLLELVRGCRQELPGAGLLLSFRADHATEADRARVVPVGLISGYLPRPLTKDGILEAVAKLPVRSADRR